MSLVEGLEFVEGEIANDIRVEDKEGRVVLAEDIASKGQRTSYKQLNQQGDRRREKMTRVGTMIENKGAEGGGGKGRE